MLLLTADCAVSATTNYPHQTEQKAEMDKIATIQKQIMKLTTELSSSQKSNAVLMTKLNEQQDQLNKLHFVVDRLERTAEASTEGLQFSTYAENEVYESQGLSLRTEVYEKKSKPAK